MCLENYKLVILTSVTVLPQQATLQPSTEPQIAADAATNANTAMSPLIIPIYSHCISRRLHLSNTDRVHAHQANKPDTD